MLGAQQNIETAGAGALWGRGRAGAVRNTAAPGGAARRSQLSPFVRSSVSQGPAIAGHHVFPRAWWLAPLFMQAASKVCFGHGPIEARAIAVAPAFGFMRPSRLRHRQAPRPLRLLFPCHCPTSSTGARRSDDVTMPGMGFTSHPNRRALDLASTQLIKALCRRIEARYGSGKAAAMAANVTAGVWSTYCSDEHADTTIPFHRVLYVGNASEKAAFAALLLEGDEPSGASLTTEASECTEAAALLQSDARHAGENITPLKARQLNDRVGTALVELMDVARAIPKAG